MTDDDEGHATSEALHDVEPEADFEQCQRVGTERNSLEVTYKVQT